MWTNFIPQMIFFQGIFGYLVLCILYKWSIDWSKASTSPPSLLNMLISMFLEPGKVDPANQLYRGQGGVQFILLIAAGVCVPILLCAKPYLAWQEMKKTKEEGYVSLSARDDLAGGVTGGETNGFRDDDALEGEEEGNGRAVLEQHDEEHVSPFFSLLLSLSSCSFHLIAYRTFANKMKL